MACSFIRPAPKTFHFLRFDAAAIASTCRKRVIVCEVYDAAGDRLACESNRCEPAFGLCQRLGVANGQQDYPADSDCHWTHAEIRAIAALKIGDKPERAVVYGHEFVCPSCEAALRRVGVTQIDVVPLCEGTGLRDR